MAKHSKGKNDGEGDFIFRPYITVKGKRIYASWYGKKAFRIPNPDTKRDRKKKDK